MEFTARAKAFSSEGVRKHRFHFDGDHIRVYDPVAGHFTLVHSLSQSAIKRLIRIADDRAIPRRGMKGDQI